VICCKFVAFSSIPEFLIGAAPPSDINITAPIGGKLKRPAGAQQQARSAWGGGGQFDHGGRTESLKMGWFDGIGRRAG
jgi:hypothetical protein